MNNPTSQLENGYTPIANKILEDLCKINLTAYQARVIWCIFRKTYGYHKKEDWISVSQIVEFTGLKQSHVSRTKKELLLRGLIYTPMGMKIAFQKDSSLWKDIPNEVYRKNIPREDKNIPREVFYIPHQGNTKDNIQKKITKDSKEAFDQSIRENKNTLPYSDHNENIDVAKPNHKEIINNVKIKLPTCKNCGHCSLCSLTPCTEQELYDLAMKMNLNLKDVKFKHQQIIDMLEDGSFRQKYKKHKTVFNTLRKWLEMSIERGYIQKMNEMERMCLQSDSPEMKERMKKAFYKLEHGETPWTLKKS